MARVRKKQAHGLRTTDDMPSPRWCECLLIRAAQRG
jgi:hypothetical protein